MRSERKKGIKNDCQVVGITTDKWTCWMLTKLGKALRADVSGPAGNPSSVWGTVKFRAMPNPRDMSVGHSALKIPRRENFTKQAKCGEERRHLGQTNPGVSITQQSKTGQTWGPSEGKSSRTTCQCHSGLCNHDSAWQHEGQW